MYLTLHKLHFRNQWLQIMYQMHNVIINNFVHTYVVSWNFLKWKMSTWSYISRIIVLITACWLIIDIILDGIQAPKYWKLSPYLNKNHEANLNLTMRIVQLCKKLEKTQFIQSIFNELRLSDQMLRHLTKTKMTICHQW